jgi:hypothetical protein
MQCYEAFWPHANFSAGLAAYRRRDWTKAETLFNDLLKKFPEDRPSLLLLRRVMGSAAISS